MTVAWLSPLATEDRPDGTVALLLTKTLYDASVQIKPELAARLLVPLVNVYDPAHPENSVNLTYANLAEVQTDWPSYWYDPNDV